LVHDLSSRRKERKIASDHYIGVYGGLFEDQRPAANFKTLIQALDIDFIDFDYEPDSYDKEDRERIVNLASLIDVWGAKSSFCPYAERSWWIECLADAYERLGRQPIEWMNLQCYDGGADNDPVEWAEAIKRHHRPTGIADPYRFVVPGYWVKQNYPDKEQYGKCPDQIEKIFEDLKARGLSGGWLWNIGDIFKFEDSGFCGSQDVTPKGYSDAVLRGSRAELDSCVTISPLRGALAP
jgi:hypothetical protein